jgi:hypothetical protein
MTLGEFGKMIVEALIQALMISAFVFVMLLAIEYINMSTGGAAQRVVCGGQWRQYLLAAGLGASPGCLGAFASVSLYVHGLLSFGALVGCMIATSGDEAFVLLAVNPKMGLFLTAILFVIGLMTAWLTDFFLQDPQLKHKLACRELVVHGEATCGPFSWRKTVGYWKPCSAHRGILTIGLLLFIGAVSLGELGPQEWNWIRITFLLVSVFTVFVVATVPDHFLEEHLWRHVAVMHVPRIFIWTFGALLVTRFASDHVGLDQWIHQNPVTVLVLACLLGIIPESGPHLVFVTLFSEGSIPFSILLASSIVQDGHGMLPLLGESFKAFAVVKTVNLTVGLLIGFVAFASGW